MKPLTKSELMKKVINDKYKKKYSEREVDRYVTSKSAEGKRNAAMHTKRYSHHKIK